jgi:hypothetical protein
MILRLFALALASAAALLTYEFFKTLLVGGSTFNTHYVIAGSAGVVLAQAGRMWSLRRKHRSVAESGKSLGNSI